MKIWKKLAAIGVVSFAGGFAAIYAFSQKDDSAVTKAGEKQANSKPVEVEWGILRELDLSTGVGPEALTKLNNSLVKVPGFIIPLEDDQTSVSEFLLVPSPMSCVHVPPPPANQVIHVKMASGKKAEMSFGPVWLHGRLRISEATGPFGKSSYEITGELTEPFQ